MDEKEVDGGERYLLTGSKSCECSEGLLPLGLLGLESLLGHWLGLQSLLGLQLLGLEPLLGLRREDGAGQLGGSGGLGDRATKL